MQVGMQSIEYVASPQNTQDDASQEYNSVTNCCCGSPNVGKNVCKRFYVKYQPLFVCVHKMFVLILPELIPR